VDSDAHYRASLEAGRKEIGELLAQGERFCRNLPSLRQWNEVRMSVSSTESARQAARDSLNAYYSDFERFRNRVREVVEGLRGVLPSQEVDDFQRQMDLDHVEQIYLAVQRAHNRLTEFLDAVGTEHSRPAGVTPVSRRRAPPVRSPPRPSQDVTLPDQPLSTTAAIAIGGSHGVSPRQRLSSVVESMPAAQRAEEFRRTKGWTVSEFAEHAQTTERTLRKFFKTGKVRHSIFVDIAKAMNVGLEELLKPPSV
jgi:hypothetical protein